MPDEGATLDAAVKLVVTGQVTLSPDGRTATILFPDGRAPWQLSNGTCPCEADGWCVHLLARALLRKTSGLMAAPPLPDALEPSAAPADPQTASIPPQFLVQIHGKLYILYAGLLALAHERGVLSLQAELVSVTADLAIAKATARFKDGSVWTEAADASPGNVNKGVRLHFARCALTRAKARCLRDALNISLVAAEEL